MGYCSVKKYPSTLQLLAQPKDMRLSATESHYGADAQSLGTLPSYSYVRGDVAVRSTTGANRCPR